MCRWPSTIPGRVSTSTSRNDARWISAKLRICACANLISSIVCGATLATSASTSLCDRRKLGGDHLSKRSLSSRTAASPRLATSAMIVSTLLRTLASASSCWPASAAILMCRGMSSSRSISSLHRHPDRRPYCRTDLVIPAKAGIHRRNGSRLSPGRRKAEASFSVSSVSGWWEYSPRGPAAVDEQARPGHETGGGGGEEDDRRGDLLDCAAAADRNPVEDPFAGLRVVEKRLRQRSQHKGRRDRDDPHPLGRELDRHCLGQPLDGVLSHPVDGAVQSGADMRHLRRHVDVDSAAIGDHQPCGRLGNEKRCPDVEPEKQVEGPFVDLEKGLRAVEPGIVDQDVETAETGEGLAHRRAVGDVEGQRPRPAAVRSNLPCGLVELARCPAHQYQLGAGSGERHCCRAADAAAGP